jgi:hypothetical protein
MGAYPPVLRLAVGRPVTIAATAVELGLDGGDGEGLIFENALKTFG